MRGSVEAYNALPHKDNDTLYFISNADENDAILYLGNKIIAGGDNLSIHELSNILVKELNNRDILVYDATQEKWVNTKINNIIEVFVGATENSNGVSGLVPIPPKGQTELFLKSDGTWATINSIANSNNIIITAQNDIHKNHNSIISECVQGIISTSGDIIIIKDKIQDNYYQHTAYVYNGNNWKAMDGNYNANNIYFDQDFIVTENIGAIEVNENDGNVVLSTKNKNLQQLMTEIFAKEKFPEVKYPTASLNFIPNIYEYEIGTVISPKYQIKFDSGEYEYDASTQVTVLSYDIIDSNDQQSNLSTGVMPELTIADDTEYFIKGIIQHSAGIIPKTNLGNDDNTRQIKKDNINLISNTITGFRNSFFGTVNDNKIEINSINIRAELNALDRRLSTGDQITLNIPVGAQRVIIAYPDTLGEITSIKDVNALNTEIKSSFKLIKMNVESKNNYDSIPYKIYYLDYALPKTSSNIYQIII